MHAPVWLCSILVCKKACLKWQAKSTNPKLDKSHQDNWLKRLQTSAKSLETFAEKNLYLVINQSKGKLFWSESMFFLNDGQSSNWSSVSVSNSSLLISTSYQAQNLLLLWCMFSHYIWKKKKRHWLLNQIKLIQYNIDVKMHHVTT